MPLEIMIGAPVAGSLQWYRGRSVATSVRVFVAENFDAGRMHRIRIRSGVHQKCRSSSSSFVLSSSTQEDLLLDNFRYWPADLHSCRAATASHVEALAQSVACPCLAGV
jgi:hypothetical protein